MAAPTAIRHPYHWKITLNIVNGQIEADGDWDHLMNVGDTASFTVKVPSNEGSAPTAVVLVFESQPATANGEAVPISYLPFGSKNIRDPLPTKSFTVKRSCKSMMKIKMLINGKWVWCNQTERGEVTGKNVCTGGGSNPVTC